MTQMRKSPADTGLNQECKNCGAWDVTPRSQYCPANTDWIQISRYTPQTKKILARLRR